MQHLILSRHGNTFAPGDTVFWVGAKNDLPLVESGIAQAEALAQSFLSSGTAPEIIYCGPLQRTRKYAEIVRHKLAVATPIIIDNRLDELDYGQWSGLTDAQVQEKFGKEDLENWTKSGIWPKSSSWGSSENEVAQQVVEFTNELKNDSSSNKNILAVTSNGRLRYFLRLFPKLFNDYSNQHKLTVGTGKISIISHLAPDLILRCWNLDPKDAIPKII